MSMIGNFFAVGSQKLDELLKRPDRVSGFLNEILNGNQGEDYLDIDKSWHGIHFLLTGSAWEGEAPLKWVILAPREVGEDVGYGPARILTPSEVLEVSQALELITPDQLKARYDWKLFNQSEIYPPGWRRGDEEYILSYHERLKKLYQSAARRGKGIIQWTN